MTRKELLDEGYLVAYITEELDAAQVTEVEQYIASDPEIAYEYNEMQRLVEQIAFQYGIAPGDVVKQQVMQAPEVMENLAHYEGQPSAGSGWKLMMAASIIVTLSSLFTAFYYWSEYKDTDDRLAELTARNLELAESYHIVNQELSDIRNDLAVLVSPEFKRVILNGTPNNTDGTAVIYWNPAEEEVYLNSANLAQLPQNQQYQLWALIDGQPVDAGVFDAEVGRFQIMKNIASADAFAVTVEEAGGAESPTLSTMQVYGEAG